MEPTYSYDVEVFPNFFSVVFENVDDLEDSAFFYIWRHDRKQVDQRDELRAFVDRPITLTGFNNLDYDNVILNLVIDATDPVPRLLPRLYRFSKMVIDEDRPWSIDGYKALRYLEAVQYKSIDLMRLHNLAKRVSLKQVGIMLGYRQLQDLPFPHDQEILEEQIQDVLDYNAHDVEITRLFYHASKSELNVRQKVGDFFGIELMSHSRSDMGYALMGKLWEDETGQHPKEYKKGRSPRAFVRAADIIPDNVSYKTTALSSMLRYIRSLILTEEQKFKYAHRVSFGGVDYDIGIGGLHSVDRGGYFQSRDDLTIRDADVTSYYPNLILNLNVRPEHLGDQFFNLYRQVVAERTANKAKAKDDPVADTIQEGLKIAINSVFGRFGNEWTWLYDPKAMLTVTVNGQLYLLMLIERLHLAGIQTLSANTDGITCIVRKGQEADYQQVCKQWQDDTGLSLEFADYAHYWRRDVNNYLVVKSDGRVKSKGIFDTSLNFSGGYSHPVVYDAMVAYLRDGTPLIDTFRASSIHRFFIAQRVARKYRVFFEQDGVVEEKQRTNRYFAATKGGNIYKECDGKKISLLANQPAVVLNTVDDLDVSHYPVDFDFYTRKAQEELDKVLGVKMAGLPFAPPVNEFTPYVEETLYVPSEDSSEVVKSTRKAALFYVSKGFKIFPVWPVNEDGSCRCGNRECANIGKHPVTFFGSVAICPRGYQDATDSPLRVNQWWNMIPDANIGTPSYLRIDVDTKEGGIANWSGLLEEHGDIDCPVVISGSGGRHYFFLPGDDYGHTNRTGRLPKGIDVRGHGSGYTILPPSNHVKGMYVWDENRHIRNIEIKPAPEWLVSILPKDSQVDGSAFTLTQVNNVVDLGKWELSPRALHLITTAPHEEADRSSNDFVVVYELVRAGASPNEILEIYETFPIGTAENSKYGSKREARRRYLSLTIANARKRLEANGAVPMQYPELDAETVRKIQEMHNQAFWKGFHTKAEQDRLLREWLAYGVSQTTVNALDLGYTDQIVIDGSAKAGPALTVPCRRMDGTVYNVEYHTTEERSIWYQSDSLPPVNILQGGHEQVLLFCNSMTGLSMLERLGGLPFSFGCLPSLPLRPESLEGIDVASITVYCDPDEKPDMALLKGARLYRSRKPLLWMVTEANLDAVGFNWLIKQAEKIS